MRLHREILAAAIVLGCLSPSRAAAPPPASIHWASSIATGLAEAKTKGCPLMVALNMDKERGNEAMAKEVYHDPLVLSAAARCVCAIASMGSHSEVSDPAAGRRVCSKFGTIGCAEHQAIEMIVRTDWLKKKAGEDTNSPQHFFLAPDGRRLFQRTWTMDARELAGLMARALELCDPATLAAWDTLEGRLARAGDPMQPVRAEALRNLAAMKDPAVDQKLADIARKATAEDVQGDVLDAFAGAMNPARLALAVALLDAKSTVTRMHAAAAVEAAKGPEALKALTAALGREKESEVRAYLYRSVAGCAPEDPAAKALVMGGLKEKGPAVLPHVIVALAPWGKDPAVIAALKGIPNSKEIWQVRAAACWTLGFSEDKEVAGILREVKDVGKGAWLGSIAKMAVGRIAGSVGDNDYRHSLKYFAPTPVRHPGDPDE